MEGLVGEVPEAESSRQMEILQGSKLEKVSPSITCRH